MTTDPDLIPYWIELTRIQILSDLFAGLIDRKTADYALETLKSRWEDADVCAH